MCTYLLTYVLIYASGSRDVMQQNLDIASLQTFVRHLTSQRFLESQGIKEVHNILIEEHCPNKES